MKPNFDTMSKAELKAYVLAHKDDEEAFYKLVDRLKADNQDAVWYAPPKTPEEVAIMKRVIQEKINKIEKS
jgi:putative heme degradation protein